MQLAPVLSGLFLVLTAVDFTEAVLKVRPAVVSIVTNRVAARPDGGMAAARSLGSGFVIDTLGNILTCNHVVAGYADLSVRFSDGTSYEGDDIVVVGRDPATDLAVIKVKPKRSYSAIEFADSDELQVGQWVMAIGSPFGLQGSASAGVISGLSRWGLAKSSGPDFQDFIQTDALINPGNSGGPLVDIDGRVVGVASFVKSAESEFTGIGFCTPSNLAREVAGELIDQGVVIRGYLGVNTQPLTPGLCRALGIGARYGVLVASVAAQGPAAKAGIEPGDVILELDSNPVRYVRSFQTEIADRQPGTSVRLGIIRKQQRIEAIATLGAWPVIEPSSRTDAADRAQLGLYVRTLNAADRARTRQNSGVVVEMVEPASAAADAGLRPGDVIVQVNFTPVVLKSDFESAVTAAGGRPLLVRVWRGRTAFYVALEF